MDQRDQIYVDGAWVASDGDGTIDAANLNRQIASPHGSGGEHR